MKWRQRGVWLLLLGGGLLAAVFFSLSVGSSPIAVSDIIRLLAERDGGMEAGIILDLRLPRIMLGLAVGGSLSLAGVLLQGVFRNPLVEPYTLGISGGAALGVCVAIVAGFKSIIGGFTLPAAGFIGAMTVIIAVYSLSARKGVLKVQGLLLTGVMISFVASSIMMLLMTLSRAEDVQGIVFWIMGSLDEPKQGLIYLTMAVALLGLAVSYFYSIRLNAFSLGEEEARHLGVNTEAAKRVIFVAASLLTGCSVAVAGVIGFVGLVVPHFARMLLGQDHRVLLLGSFLMGAIFLILSDTLARTIILPLELPVGVVTGILGGILFIWALNRRGRLL